MRKVVLYSVVMSAALACHAQVPAAPSTNVIAALPATPLAHPAPQLADAPSASRAALPDRPTSDDSPAVAFAGNWEIGVTVGGGHSFQGGLGATGDTGLFNTNVRLGYVISHEHGSGPLRGTFEYAGEITPVNVIFQQTNVYGFSVTPVIVKWNFTAAKRVVPYVEAGGGLLITASDVPVGANTLNFTPQAAVGLQIFHRPNRAVSAAVHWVHISDAYLTRFNPGIDSIQFTLGYHWWKQH